MLILIILFLLWKTELYVPVVTLSAKYNQKLSKLLSKGFERSMYWNEYKKKLRIKIREKRIDFSRINFVGVNRLFLLVYLNRDTGIKRYKPPGYYLPKDTVKSYNVITIGKFPAANPLVLI